METGTWMEWNGNSTGLDENGSEKIMGRLGISMITLGTCGDGCDFCPCSLQISSCSLCAL